MSMSNIEYSVLKKKAGLHNWGYLPMRQSEDEYASWEDLDLAQEEDWASDELLHQNDYGEFYALQDYEE